MTNLLDKNKTSEKLSEIAHLMRRASFGASPSELESLIKIPYEDLVDSLIVVILILLIHIVHKFQNDFEWY